MYKQHIHTATGSTFPPPQVENTKRAHALHRESTRTTHPQVRCLPAPASWSRSLDTGHTGAAAGPRVGWAEDPRRRGVSSEGAVCVKDQPRGEGEGLFTQVSSTRVLGRGEGRGEVRAFWGTGLCVTPPLQ